MLLVSGRENLESLTRFAQLIVMCAEGKEDGRVAESNWERLASTSIQFLLFLVNNLPQYKWILVLW